MTGLPANKLALTLPLVKGETASSMAVRLASRNGVSKPREFLNDMGISAREFRRGCDQEIVQFAHRSGIPFEDLRRYSVIHLGGEFFEINGQRLRRPVLARSSIRFCPKCSLQAFEKRGAHGVYQLAEWSVMPIATCAMHQCQLHLIDLRWTTEAFDLGAFVGKNISDVERLARESSKCPETEFENYFRNRLYGAASETWLDSRAFYAAAMACSQLGLLIKYGSHGKISTLSNAQLREIDEAGFQVLTAGPDALVEALDALKSDAPISRLGFSRDHKVFFDWLNRANLGADFEPIREIVREFIFKAFPIPKGERVFGVPCPKRYVHTLKTVSAQHRVRTTKVGARFQELVMLEKDCTTGEMRMPSYFDADFADAVASSLKEMLDAKGAQRYLNTSLTCFQQLVNAEHIKPDLKVGKAAKRYAVTDLEFFSHRLSEGAILEPKLLTHCKTISRASLNAKCRMIDVIEMILEGKLTYLGKLEDVSGIGALLVDCAEVRKLQHSKPTSNLMRGQVKKAIGVNDTTVKRLLQSGILKSYQGRSPTSGHAATLVSAEAISDFKSNFITLSEFAGRIGMQPTKANQRLASVKIEPVLSGDGVNFVFRRSEVAGLLTQEL